MTAICDVYDAITSDRPYNRAGRPGVALQRMAQWCNTPPGCADFRSLCEGRSACTRRQLVRLQSGLLGVVLRRAQNSMSTPQVVAFYHIGLQRMLRPAKLLDLEKLPNERIVARRRPSAMALHQL